MGNKRKIDESPQETLNRLMKKMRKVSKEVEEFQSKLNDKIIEDEKSEDSESSETETPSETESKHEDKENVPANSSLTKSTPEELGFDNPVGDETSTTSEGELDWMEIVGDDPSKSDALAAQIREDLLKVWKANCREGHKKDEEDTLLKKYECAADFRVPELNPQVVAKLSATAKARDGHMVTIQKLGALAMTVVGSLMTKIHDSRKEGLDIIDILEPLRDVGKLLTLLIYKQSQNRKAFIEPGMTKEALEIIKDTKIEDFLFGNDLSTKIKEIRALGKEGEGLMKAPLPAATSSRPLRARHTHSVDNARLPSNLC